MLTAGRPLGLFTWRLIQRSMLVSRGNVCKCSGNQRAQLQFSFRGMEEGIVTVSSSVYTMTQAWWCGAAGRENMWESVWCLNDTSVSIRAKCLTFRSLSRKKSCPLNYWRNHSWSAEWLQLPCTWSCQEHIFPFLQCRGSTGGTDGAGCRITIKDSEEH